MKRVVDHCFCFDSFVTYPIGAMPVFAICPGAGVVKGALTFVLGVLPVRWPGRVGEGRQRGKGRSIP